MPECVAASSSVAGAAKLALVTYQAFAVAHRAVWLAANLAFAAAFRTLKSNLVFYKPEKLFFRVEEDALTVALLTLIHLELYRHDLYLPRYKIITPSTHNDN